MGGARFWRTVLPTISWNWRSHHRGNGTGRKCVEPRRYSMEKYGDLTLGDSPPVQRPHDGMLIQTNPPLSDAHTDIPLSQRASLGILARPYKHSIVPMSNCWIAARPYKQARMPNEVRWDEGTLIRASEARAVLTFARPYRQANVPNEGSPYKGATI